MRHHHMPPIRHLRKGGMLPILHYKNGKYLAHHHLRLATEQGSRHLITKGSGVMMDLPKPPARKFRPLKFKY